MNWLQKQVLLRTGRKVPLGIPSGSFSSSGIPIPSDVENLEAFAGAAGPDGVIDMTWEYGPGNPLLDFEIQYNLDDDQFANPTTIISSVSSRNKAIGPSLASGLWNVRIRARNSLTVVSVHWITTEVTID